MPYQHGFVLLGNSRLGGCLLRLTAKEAAHCGQVHTQLNVGYADITCTGSVTLRPCFWLRLAADAYQPCAASEHGLGHDLEYLVTLFG